MSFIFLHLLLSDISTALQWISHNDKPLPVLVALRVSDRTNVEKTVRSWEINSIDGPSFLSWMRQNDPKNLIFSSLHPMHGNYRKRFYLKLFRVHWSKKFLRFRNWKKNCSFCNEKKCSSHKLYSQCSKLAVIDLPKAKKDQNLTKRATLSNFSESF